VSVRQLPGIQKVTGEFRTGKLVVTYDQNQVTPEQIEEKITGIGYQVIRRFKP
jgi:copper chaperone CopZ